MLISDQSYPNGMYPLMQQEVAKEHYAILTSSRYLPDFGIDGSFPVPFHQTPPRVRVDPFKGSGTWVVLEKISDEATAVDRMRRIERFHWLYRLLLNNCEQVARYVATGKHESTQ